jgi:hypothetical protein
MKRIALFLLILPGILISCTKTEELPPLAQNKIVSYKVTNLPDTVIYAGIDNIDNTITVYVPFYYGLNVIDPEIKLSTGATLMEEILPVNVDDTTKKYTVKAADGSTNIYKLKIVQLNPASLDIQWSAGDNPITYPGSVLPSISGNLNSTNTSLAKVELISEKTGIATSLKLNDAYILLSTYDGVYTLYNPAIPATIDTGVYKVQLTFLGNKKSPPTTVHIIHRAPNPIVSSKVAKQGETITFNPINGVFINPASVTVSVNGTSYDLAIVSWTPTDLVLRIPDTFPVGSYDSALYTFAFNGWPVVKKTGLLIVNAK